MMPAPAFRLAVRPALEDDLGRIAWLEEAALAHPWPYELLAYELGHPRGFVLVADPGGGVPLSGYAAFRHGGGESEMLRLAVDPAERRQGVARALVESALDRLRLEGIRTCFLEVRMDNEGAIAFYHALGFQRTGRRRSYYQDGADALVLSLALGPPAA